MRGSDAVFALSGALEKAGIGYMLVGSFSSNFYGIPRSTKDADVVVQLNPDNWHLLARILPDGIVVDPQASFETVTGTRRQRLTVLGSYFEIELFMLSADPHDQERFVNRVQVEVAEGQSVFLPKAEDVVIQKLRWAMGANRSKDRDDVLAILEVSGSSLDWSYMKRWTIEHQTNDLLKELCSQIDNLDAD